MHIELAKTPPDFGIWVAGYLFGFPVVNWLASVLASKLEKRPRKQLTLVCS